MNTNTLILVGSALMVMMASIMFCSPRQSTDVQPDRQSKLNDDSNHAATEAAVTSSAQLQPNYSVPANSSQPIATYRPHHIRSRLSAVMAALSAVKIELSEYYLAHGVMPENDEQLDLSVYDLEEYEDISAVRLIGKGGVEASLSPYFGEDKWLRIQPNLSKHGAHIKWSCETNISKSMLGSSFAKQCQSVN